MSRRDNAESSQVRSAWDTAIGRHLQEGGLITGYDADDIFHPRFHLSRLGRINRPLRDGTRLLLVLECGDAEGWKVGMVEGWVSAFAELHPADADIARQLKGKSAPKAA